MENEVTFLNLCAGGAGGRVIFLDDVGFNAVFGLLHIKACVSLIPENPFKTAMVVLFFSVRVIRTI